MNPQNLFNALADSTRRRILALLTREGELCVCELSAALGEIQPKVSRHLAVLRDAEIIQQRREGTWMFYKLSHPLPGWIDKLLSSLTEGGIPELSADGSRLKSMPGRPDSKVRNKI